MRSPRKVAVMAGVVFIVATVAGLAGSALMPDPSGTDYLMRFAAQANRASFAALLHLIAYLASASIAVVMYPILSKWNVGLALGSVVFRTIEAAFYMVGLVCLLSLVPLGQQVTSAVTGERVALQAVGDALVNVHNRAALLGVAAFCAGAFLYYSLFFQSRLIPRWLSGWGIIAILLMFTACLLSLFSGKLISSYIPLAFPIFLQEMVLAIWLIVKGFNPSAIPAQKGEAR